MLFLPGSPSFACCSSRVNSFLPQRSSTIFCPFSNTVVPHLRHFSIVQTSLPPRPFTFPFLGTTSAWALCPGSPGTRDAHTAQDSSRDAHLHHCDKNRNVCKWRIASVIATQGLENEPTTHREQKERHCRTQRKLAEKTQNVKQLPSRSSTDDVEPQRPLERKWLEPKWSRNQVLCKSRALQCWSEDSVENVIGTTCGEVACGIDHGISELGEIATKFSNRAVVQSVFDTW